MSKISVRLAVALLFLAALPLGCAQSPGSPAKGSGAVDAGTLAIGFKAGWGAFRIVRGASSGLHVTIGFGIVLWGLLVALAVAILGGAIPAWLIARIRPAEVMRNE